MSIESALEELALESLDAMELKDENKLGPHST